MMMRTTTAATGDFRFHVGWRRVWNSLAIFGLTLSCAIALPTDVHGQVGVSSSSVAMFRSGVVPHPDAILVEDFFNYHRHDIAMPSGGKAMALDTRWGTAAATKDYPEAYLQVGLATRRYDDEARIPPLNLALVIDRSGSMSGDRIAKVKQALQTFVHKLRDIDRVSIVSFSEHAVVNVESRLVDDTTLIERAIESIDADGSTNLHAGLMLGYEQVEKHFDDRCTNRVILLTDGLANRGVTDDEQITMDSRAMNETGIDLSTIGVGSGFNYRLMRQLARAGRGLIHFVGDDEDIEKVFVDELQSMLTLIARDVQVEIEFGKELQLKDVFGYSPRFGDRSVSYALDNLNAGATQVLLHKFQVAPELTESAEIPLTVRLKYYDIMTRQDVEEAQTLTLNYQPGSEQPIDPLTDAETRKCIAIAELAQSFIAMSRLIEEDKIDEAQKVLQNHSEITRQRYPMLLDEDVKRVIDMAEKFAAEMETFVANRDGQ